MSASLAAVRGDCLYCSASGPQIGEAIPSHGGGGKGEGFTALPPRSGNRPGERREASADLRHYRRSPADDPEADPDSLSPLSTTSLSGRRQRRQRQQPHVL